MIQSLLTNLFGERFKESEIKPGAKYLRIEPTITETAQVLSVDSNDLGISHVRYIGHFEARHGHGAEYVDQRRIALSKFQAEFRPITKNAA